VDRPPAFTLLHGVVIPPVGGDTLWANTVTAYQSLPAELRDLADRLRIVHTNDYDYAAVYGRGERADPAVTAQRQEFVSTVYETEHPAVRQLAAELAPPAVRNGPGQAPVADHARDMEVLDRDQVVAADQLSGRAVQEVSPGVADLAVGPGDLGLRLGPVGRAALAAGQPPLVAGQAGSLALQVAGVGDPVAVAGHREVVHAQVNTHGAAGRGQRLRRPGVDGQRHVPAAVGFSGHDHGARVQPGHVHIRPRPHERQRARGLGQAQLPFAQGERRPGVLGRLAAGAGLEPRVAGSSGEERGERLLLVAQGLLQRDTRHLVQPGPLRVLLHRRQRRRRLAIRRARALRRVPFPPRRQDGVPDHADGAEGAVQHRLLRRVGIGPAPVGRPHAGSLPGGADKTLPCRPGHRIPARPESRRFLRRSR
jgi:hypothetical protein